MNTTNQDRTNDKTVFRFVIALSLIIFFAVIVLNRKILPRPLPVPQWVYFLPLLNALINGTCSILLVVSFYYIRQGKISLHKKINIATFILSSTFLVSYILYHWMADETSYPAESGLRPVYLTILVSHIVLAALVLPLVLMSFYRGLQMQVPMHKKLVRWAFPIWLYVTVTGVIVYLMISPYYNH